MNAEIIKQLREFLNMTQEELAQKLEVSFVTINRWENSKTRPSRFAVKALRTLAVECGFILNGKGVIPSSKQSDFDPARE